MFKCENCGGLVKWILIGAALILGIGGGYYYAVQKERAAQEATNVANEKAATDVVNPFENTTVNPFKDSPANPYKDIKTNPFE